MKIGIIANPEKKGESLLRELARRFEANSVEIGFDRVTAGLIGRPGGSTLREVADWADLLVILGGDGSILYTLRHLGDQIKPLAAINTGTLGFMTCATGEEVEPFVNALCARTYTVTNRTLLQCRIELPDGASRSAIGLNEVTLSRKSDSRVIHIEASINGHFANHYTGDGLIVATATGSTAYSLSAGGPLVDPGANCFILTPVCPHSLSNRPLILDAGSKIELSIPEQRDDLTVTVTVDGPLIANASAGTRVLIERASFDLPLLSLPGQTFFGVLHQKLRWTGSAVPQ